MAKQLAAQKYILKISTARLRRAKWDLTLPISEARKNDELISLNDSQMLRWIDELNGVGDVEDRVRYIKSQIRATKKLENSTQNRRRIRSLYDELDALQFKPDYLHLVIDKDKDLHRACKGFKVNGIRYARLLGTNGGVKESTIVFVSERLVTELRERIDNGRNTSVHQIPAKLEAYRALTCSGSIPVSMPKGILVVPDCETTFKEDIIMLNDEGCIEPKMEYVKDAEITLDESDGYGLMTPSLAERWSQELHLDYVASGMNTRFSWEKGMVFTFDFRDFAEKVAGKYIVKDAWGNDVDIRNVELVLTTSMVKLWACYESLEHYLSCCEANHYTFGIAKTCPEELERVRSLNYQFIQSYNLTDEQIDELVQPTIDEIKDVLGGDYRKAILFLRGTHITEENVEANIDHVVSSLMVEPKMMDDPHVKRRIYHMIERRIRDAKIGVVDVHGNYSIICGDPYALCQNIFELPVTGLLRAGQLYNRYWSDVGAAHVACFRAPMTCHNNIRKMEVANTEEMAYWYQYMTTCTMLNAWDTTTQALNGADKDGDLIFLTDNRVLVENIRPTPTIFCVQRKGAKIDVLEDDLIRSNIASFGDDIGRTTNWITSMFDVQAQYPAGSVEYETLDYRIKCGQLYQQNAIDKAKGIVCKPMPRAWYDFHANKLPDNPSEEDCSRRELGLKILADKKPYFMRYIYPALMKDYNTYIKNTNVKCLREFRMDLKDLLEADEDSLSDRQKEFIRYYHSRMPVGMNDCVMNRICRRFEAEFDGYLKLHASKEDFDYSILKNEDAEYTKTQYYTVAKLYAQHNEWLQAYRQMQKKLRLDNSESRDADAQNMNRVFEQEYFRVCSNASVLCNIVVDMCYRKIGSQQFAWDVCGSEIFHNLLKRNDYMLYFPVRDPEGDITYCGHRFSMKGMKSQYGRDCSERETMDRGCDSEWLAGE